MTVGELATRCASRLGEDYADREVGEQFRDMVADTVRELLNRENWTFSRLTYSFDTVATTSEYTLSAALREVRAIYRIGSDGVATPIEYLSSPETLFDRGINTASTGTPQSAWADRVTNTQFVLSLFPIPDAVVTVRLFSNFRVLSSFGIAADLIPVPDDVLHVLQSGVEERFYGTVGDAEAAVAAKERWEGGIVRLQERYQHPAAVHYRFDYSDLPVSGGLGYRTPETVS